MTLDQILLAAIPPVPDCEPKNNAAAQKRAEIKKKIEDWAAQRDKTQPYKPDLEYKKQ